MNLSLETSLLLFGLFDVAVILFVAALLYSRHASRRQATLLAEAHRADAIIEGECMVNESSLSEPGIAQIADGRLLIRTVLGRSFDLPLDRVSVIKEYTSWGRWPWIGRRVFKLRAPFTSGLALGVKNPEAWQPHLPRVSG